MTLRLDWLTLHDFRNVTEASLRFSPGFNLIVGENGQGKSNLLEAIALLATGRSFRRAAPAVMGRYGTTVYRVSGDSFAQGLSHRLTLSGENHRQVVRLNGKVMAQASAMGQALAAVVFSPDAPGLIQGTPGERRDYLDWVVFSQDRRHAATARDYHSALKARNRLLKTGCQDPHQLSAWEDRLAVLGAVMTERRRLTVARLTDSLPDYLEGLGLDPTRFGLKLTTQLDRHLGQTGQTGHDRGAFEDSEVAEAAMADLYRRLLAQSRPGDQRHGVTSVGPHRDDLPLLIDGHLLSRHGSRGQRKRFLLALKLTEARLMQERLGEPPLFLLDDPAAELDPDGIQKLLDLLADQQRQTFLTSCRAEDIPRLPTPPRLFSVVDGRFQTLNGLDSMAEGAAPCGVPNESQ